MSYPSKREASTTIHRKRYAPFFKLSYPSKREASTTIQWHQSYDGNRCHTPPNERLLQLAASTYLRSECCHTPPNERLLQHLSCSADRGSSCHTPPNERLLQLRNLKKNLMTFCCHTPPNERLLQPDNLTKKGIPVVVIPLQTRGFYNNNNINIMELTVVIPLQTRGFYNYSQG